MPSASIIPKGDATLLFTNAGMVQFKDYFLGIRTPSSKRVADSQKCLRISGKHNDLEAVGRDTYHHTFFEMLGNWSFGDYYKEAAIPWHWELITKVWKIPTDRLWATIYTDDDEAEGVWKKIPDLLPGRILRFEKENFWEMGDTGPCGPCSEIHFDRGEAACKGATHPGVKCAVNVEGCERFIELGNLVFIQYNRDASGKLTPLPMKHVDTGSGLERIAAAIQSLETGKLLGNYDIDLFRTIIRKDRIGPLRHLRRRNCRTAKILRPTYRFGRLPIMPARSVSWLRKGSRREIPTESMCFEGLSAARFATAAIWAFESIFSKSVAEGVIDAMGQAYPELKAAESKIDFALEREYELFNSALDRGLELIAEARKRLKETKGHTLPGDVAFKLYDTYGFPLDLTQDVLRSEGIDVDVAGFEASDGTAARAGARRSQRRHGRAGNPARRRNFLALRRLSRI